MDYITPKSVKDRHMKMFPCRWCGKVPDVEDPDTLHKTGIGWLEDEHYGRTYCSIREMEIPESQHCHVLNCSLQCGVQMTADTKEELLANWNRGRDVKIKN